VGISAVVETEGGEQVRALPDPAGGTFDAAGDFDRVLPEDDDSFPMLKLVDPDGDTVFAATQLKDLVAEIDRLGNLTLKPIERRGLERLRVMAEVCRQQPNLRLRFLGD
jgi:hypothetical protein